MKAHVIPLKLFVVILLTLGIGNLSADTKPHVMKISQNPEKAILKKTEQGIVLTTENEKLKVEFYTDKIVRICTSPRGILDRKSLTVIAEKEKVKWSLNKEKDQLLLGTSYLNIRINVDNGAISFFAKDGELLLQENQSQPREIKKKTIAGEDTFSLQQNFSLSYDESIQGFGQFEFSSMNYRNTDKIIRQLNAGNVLPVFLSSKGYAVLWDNASHTKWHDGDDGTYLLANAGDAIDYYFVAGDDFDQIISGYRHLTGSVPMLPKTAFGYWQSRERYGSQKEIVTEVENYRKRYIPLDYIVLDWLHWGMDDGQWSSFQFDKDYFPDPKAMTADVHANKAQIMCVHWPNFGLDTNIYKELDAVGALSQDTIKWNNTRVYDPFHPQAKEIVWEHLYNGFIKNGIDAFWLDSPEPGLDLSKEKFHIGLMAKYLNAYPLQHTENIYTQYKKYISGKRCVILTRAAWAGQQRNSTVVWSGDIPAKWSEFQNQIIGGINFSMSGMPYWTTDIGGFWNGRWRGSDFLLGHHDPAFKEFYVRWFQFGAFCPIFRAHGAHSPREIYKYGEPGDWAYDVQLQYSELRYRLLPYIYSTAWKVTNDDYTMMRGLIMDFHSDKKVYDIANEFMFGPSILVRPVTEPLYHKDELPDRPIPKGSFYSAEGVPGGLTAEYYRGRNFDELAFTRIDSSIQNYWMRYPPIDQRREDYSVRWTGFLEPNETGTFKISAMVDDGLRLWIDDKLVIDEWKDRYREYVFAQVELDENERYPLKVEYYQHEFAADIRLFWSKAGVKVKEVKTTQDVDVYLPAGPSWFDFWTGKKFNGGQTIARQVPIEIMPLYIKAGSIIPLQPKMQYVDEKPVDPIELRVYTGDDAEFALYEDEGENYNYEKGVYSLIPIRWDEKDRVLTIGKRNGSYPGVLAERTFHIVWVRESTGAGLEVVKKPDEVVKYTGVELLVKYE